VITVDEYYRMAATGVLAPDAKVELLDGEIVEMAPIGSPHAACVMRLTRRLWATIGDRALLSVQGPLRLDEHSEPEPDVMLLRHRDDTYAAAHPGPDDVLLLVEVADASAKLDRTRKVPMYLAAGVPEVWLVDLQARTIDAFRGGTAQTYRAGATIAPQAFPDIGFEVAYLLV